MLTPARATLAGVAIGGRAPVAVMAVLNVSPESFYGASVCRDPSALIRRGLEAVQAGAVLVDVGARSTAPYRAADVGVAEERERLARAVEALAAKLPVPISADTTRAEVARAALEAGARVVNDVSGLRDPAMGSLIRAHEAGVILMASPAPPGGEDPCSGVQGTPAVETVRALLAAALGRARGAGIPDERIVLDPGIGFFRHESVPWPEWDVQVLAGLPALADLGRPFCVGVSRKSFLGELTGRRAPADRLAGSLAATAAAVLAGAALIRTHDVAETVDAVRVAEALRPQPAP